MSNENKKRNTPVSPKGIMIYPRLTTPDTKYKPEGEYKVKLRVPATEAGEMVKAIDAAAGEQYQASVKEKGKQVKRADPPYAVDEEDNTVVFTFKMKASGKREDGSTYTNRPTVVDGRKKPIPANIRIGNGSTGKIAYFISPFYTPLVGAGVTLRLVAAQVINLISPERDYGFSEEEDADEINAEASSESEDGGENSFDESSEGGTADF